jgi:hypothetical protein
MAWRTWSGSNRPPTVTGQQKGYSRVRAGVIERPGDKVRAETKHVMLTSDLQPVSNRQRRVGWKLDSLWSSRGARRVDQIRRGRKADRRWGNGGLLDPGGPPTRSLRQKPDAQALRRDGGRRPAVSGCPQGGRLTIQEHELDLTRGRAVVDEDGSDPGQYCRRVGQDRFTTVRPEHSQPRARVEPEIEQCAGRAAYSLGNLFPRPLSGPVDQGHLAGS